MLVRFAALAGPRRPKDMSAQGVGRAAGQSNSSCRLSVNAVGPFRGCHHGRVRMQNCRIWNCSRPRTRSRGGTWARARSDPSPMPSVRFGSEPFLADLLIQRAGSLLKSCDWDLIVPVPLHSLKQREREFQPNRAFGPPVGRCNRHSFQCSPVKTRGRNTDTDQLTRATGGERPPRFAMRPAFHFRRTSNPGG
jgi:hypothetical protein